MLNNDFNELPGRSTFFNSNVVMFLEVDLGDAVNLTVSSSLIYIGV